MRLFCDQCGTEFSAITLRADSKFCSICGKALSDFIKQQCSSLFKSSPKGGRTGHFGRENRDHYVGRGLGRKRKNAELGNEEDDESNSDTLRKRRGRPKKASNHTNGDVDTTDETSIEENLDSEETAVQVCNLIWEGLLT
jgi:hypothetical protein